MAEQTPELIWFNGKVRPWEEATVHVWSELAVRGTSVFEGIRAYWRADEEQYRILAINEHMCRMRRSCKLLWIPADEEMFVQLEKGMGELLHALDFREHAYLRPTIYIERGRYGTDSASTQLGSYITSFPVPRPVQTDTGTRLKVSSWRRAHDLTISPMIKTGGAYQAFRGPMVEAQRAGFDDAIMLNDEGTVAETPGAAVFVVRDGRVTTPPVSSGLLESITREKVVELMRLEFGVEVEQRPIARSELYIADEVFICGTLAEVQPVVDVDHHLIGNGKPGAFTTRLRDRFHSICVDGDREPEGWFTHV